MIKYKITKKDNMRIPHVRLSKKDTICLDSISKDFKKNIFLKPCSVKNQNVVYEGIIAESLHDLLVKTMKKRDFLIIIESLIVAISTILDNGCSLNRLLLDLKTVFYDKNKQQAYFILMPFENNKNKNDVYHFLVAFVKNYKPAIENDVEYITRFKSLLEQLRGYDLHRLENFLLQEDREVVEKVRQPLSLTEENKKEHFSNIHGKPYSTYEDSDETALAPVDEKKTDIGVAVKSSDDESTVLADEEKTQLASNGDAGDFEKTVFAPTDRIQEYYLIRYSTGESIPINKLVFRLGRIKDCVDYCISDDTISGVHLDIICRDNQIYVMDLGSKNKSFINDRELTAKVETLINDGDVLCLASEKFIFCHETA